MVSKSTERVCFGFKIVQKNMYDFCFIIYGINNVVASILEFYFYY